MKRIDEALSTKVDNLKKKTIWGVWGIRKMMLKYTQNAMNHAYIAWAKDEIEMKYLDTF